MRQLAWPSIAEVQVNLLAESATVHFAVPQPAFSCFVARGWVFAGGVIHFQKDDATAVLVLQSCIRAYV